jgi:tripartite-type tricarboxylate transporter receptor subunit TctC
MRGSILAALLVAGNAMAAEAYPTHPIRYVVASAPGGIADLTARVLGPSLAKALGQPVVIENRTSGGVAVGGEAVARAPADGHTLLSVTPQLAIAPLMQRKFPFDPRKDLALVALAGVIPNVLAVSSRTPAKNLQELVELARRNPGKLNYSSTGQGTSVHLTAELFKNEAKVDIVHVPFHGSAAAINALVSGNVDMMVESALPLLSQIRSGRVRALAVSAAQRIPQLPEVPTFIESGFPGFEVNGWTGLATTGGTPADIVARLEAETRKALASPEAGALLDKAGVSVRFMGAREFSAFFGGEMDRFSVAIRQSGARIE